MLSELRKYQVGIVLAHQYLSQLSVSLRDAVLGNTGTIVVFRVGASDALFLSRNFEPEFRGIDLSRLPNHRAYTRLMINGAPSKPFALKTLTAGQAAAIRRNPFAEARP